ncbi:MAG TPA: hypothetical protein VND45_00795 [Thermoanaerobaculia bacterium]|nr:hypothetical protein [Thermoanaerobaculia bacterium]
MTYMVPSVAGGGDLFRCPSYASPPVLGRNSTTFAQPAFMRNPQQIREFSSRYAHDFRQDYQQRYSAQFHQLFHPFPDHEKGEKPSGIDDLRKSGVRAGRPQGVVVAAACAHTMWHVEQFAVTGRRGPMAAQ